MSLKIIISGGGTGGHIFPAIAVAQAIREEIPEAQILFVGAKGKMEMKKVPKAGFEIVGLPIRGLQRKLTWKNFKVPFVLLKSLFLSRKIIKQFKPDVAIGFGGYASAPLLFMANQMKVPTMIQEQNSYPGITNKILAKKAKFVCVAFPDMDNYFDPSKIVFTGNPIRASLLDQKKQGNKRFFDFGHKKTLLIFGGSLGARVLNEAVMSNYKLLQSYEDVQLIWQCGERHYESCKLSQVAKLEHVRLLPFIEDMNQAYQEADLVICRAGALTIAELSILGKASILVPSPNVAEDHQTKNASTLVKHKAASWMNDHEAKEKLIPKALELITNEDQLERLKGNIKKFAKPNAAKDIVALMKRI